MKFPKFIPDTTVVYDFTAKTEAAHRTVLIFKPEMVNRFNDGSWGYRAPNGNIYVEDELIPYDEWIDRELRKLGHK